VEDYISFLVEQWDLQQLFQLGLVVVEVEVVVVVDQPKKYLNLFDRN
jgi:hypothetical protein